MDLRIIMAVVGLLVGLVLHAMAAKKKDRYVRLMALSLIAQQVPQVVIILDTSVFQHTIILIASLIIFTCTILMSILGRINHEW